MGSSLPRPDSLSAGGADYVAGRTGSPKGRVGSLAAFLPFFFFSLFFSPSLKHKPHTQNPIVQIAFSLLYLPYYIQFLSLSLGSPTLPPPPHLSALGSVEKPALPDQRCQNWGHNFWTEDIGREPCASPPPAPPDGFITSYAAHLKPIESLGGRECLTQISTSEGVSATLGNC